MASRELRRTEQMLIDALGVLLRDNAVGRRSVFANDENSVDAPIGDMTKSEPVGGDVSALR